MWSTSSWAVIKDVGLTATGLALILSQAFMAHPKWQILTAGVVLTGGIATFHVGKVISGKIAGASPLPLSTEPHALSEPSSLLPELEVTDDD